MKRILCLIIMLISLLGLTSCDTYFLQVESGYFKYKTDGDTGYARIVGLTKEGQQQKTIVIPTMIDGHKVTTIGYPSDTIGGGVEWKCDFKSDNLENIYYPDGIYLGGDIPFYKHLPNIKNVYWGEISQNALMKFTRYKSYLDRIKVYVNSMCYYQNSFDENKILSDGTVIDYSYITIANVVYYLNDNTENTFFVDDCDGTKVNVIPPTPIRKGYKFNGWYKEKECINKWDFENDIIPKKEYDDEGNYIFKETSIYASWEEE